MLESSTPTPLELAASHSTQSQLIVGAAVMEWLSSGMSVFEVQCELGRGSFGRAVLARHLKDGQYYVIKQIGIKGMSDKEKRAALGEVQVSLCGNVSLLPGLIVVLASLRLICRFFRVCATPT